MTDAPQFKKHDRYKASSFRSYNTKMPERYDSAYFIDLFQLPLWHRRIVEELLPQIDSIDILDVGCGTGSLLLDLARGGAASLAGFDLAPNILEVAREKLLDTEARDRAGGWGISTLPELSSSPVIGRDREKAACTTYTPQD
jgi:ubiquinone/menaquinone biosynthesis C-methylase UbiE